MHCIAPSRAELDEFNYIQVKGCKIKAIQKLPFLRIEENEREPE